MADTLYTAALSYLDHLTAKGYKELTIRVYGHELEQAYQFLGGDNKLSTLTKARVAQYLASDAALCDIHNRPLAKLTVDRRRRVLRQFVEWAVETGMIKQLPWPDEAPRQ
jgi:site-specific recombinase XerD